LKNPRSVLHRSLITVFFALLLSPAYPSLATPNTVTRIVHAPYFGAGNAFKNGEGAVFWFGRISRTSNYADVRVGYNDQELIVYVAIVDNKLWYDEAPTEATLTQWDAATLYVDTSGSGALGSTSHRFSAQLANASEAFHAAYIGTNGAWAKANTAFVAKPGWRGASYNNDGDARGWTMLYRVPFASLGFINKPQNQTIWRMAVMVHDRDDGGGAPIADQFWPEGFSDAQPESWGQLSFGLPMFVPNKANYSGTATIAHKLNGAVVKDGAVGGHTICGDKLDFWTEWPEHVYDTLPNSADKYPDYNIQNQVDIADWPCFSKVYVAFPLTAIPAGQYVLSASLTLHQMGNSGDPGQAKPSLIQISSVSEDWDEAKLNWNNAPLALENLSQAQVNPMLSFPGWPGVPWTWDVTYAVIKAQQAGQPLRLVLYSADEDYHSGKYFVSSDTGDWNAAGRPTLRVAYGNLGAPVPTQTPGVTAVPVVVTPRAYLPLVQRN
jgi:hypothetical protein